MDRIVLAIDPGNMESAYAFLRMENGALILGDFAKVENAVLLDMVRIYREPDMAAAIEMIASYGMPVGREVFETCPFCGSKAVISELEEDLYLVRCTLVGCPAMEGATAGSVDEAKSVWNRRTADEPD